VRLLLLIAVAGACSEGSRKSPAPSGSGAAPRRYEPTCNASFAPKPELDAAPMCLVPAGEMVMGSPDVPNAPPRRVRISKPFYLDQYEVTNAQYIAFLRAGGHACGKAERYCFSSNDVDGYDLKTLTLDSAYEKLPARVTLAGAQAYCSWVGKRLPTEAEWELAARLDPGTGAVRTYPWGDHYKAGIANHFGVIVPRKGKLAAVGSFPEDRSAIGAVDMGGNAEEWVADCFVRTFECPQTCVDPLITTNCEQICDEGDSNECYRAHVGKGASFLSSTTAAATRIKTFPNSATTAIRCAR
jgi:formylglycine-generating enzyme required for sulfatase activity